jgi:hypothetical protein
VFDIEDILRLHSMKYQDLNLPKPFSYRTSHVFNVENKSIQEDKYIKMLNKEQKAALD